MKLTLKELKAFIAIGCETIADIKKIKGINQHIDYIVYANDIFKKENI